MRSPKAVYVGCSIVLLIVLAAVTIVTMGSFERINAKRAEIDHQVEVLDAFRGVQAAISQEAVAEAGYWRQPTPQNRARLEVTAIEVPQQIAEAREVVGPQDSGTLSIIEAANNAYADEVRRTFDQAPTGTVSGATSEDRVAGPALTRMNTVLVATITARQEALRASQHELNALTDRLRWIPPASIAVFMLVLAVCWGLVIRVGTEQTRRAEEAFGYAGQDPLTGLANRRTLVTRVTGELTAGREIALMMLDLDRFKEVNDRDGHAAGDQLLIELASVLRRCVRGHDMVARVGGDEFVVMLTDTLGVARVEPLVRSEVARVSRDRGYPVTASIGVAQAPADGTDLEDLLAVADERLYEVKRSRDRARSARATAVDAPAQVP
ncbi:MAG: diguanylate cyclase domain-containing protein [Actinomycetales bacterium]